MALRQIRKDNDDILSKKSKVVTEINEKIQILIDDMLDTMYEADGVGLAAPQIGILKRIIVIDIGEGPIIMINPEIASENGEQCEIEGCLSIPGVSGTVNRPAKVTVKFTDREGNEQKMTGKGLLARAFCHEIDHLNGVLFTDKVIDYVND
ncbi:peptide deformylase [Vallitalea okinawensis]|uniref:peptide deformylase n=1 Tax=Vallitalea okinawensis TaxID=2078660 RepID=UPI000CFB929D|nr:peptide deformylase [Vallitalea okinawensis]